MTPRGAMLNTATTAVRALLRSDKAYVRKDANTGQGSVSNTFQKGNSQLTTIYKRWDEQCCDIGYLASEEDVAVSEMLIVRLTRKHASHLRIDPSASHSKDRGYCTHDGIREARVESDSVDDHCGPIRYEEPRRRAEFPPPYHVPFVG